MKTQRIKTLIIDDEPDARFVLAELIRRFCPQLQVCCEAASVEEALESIQQMDPELVFLDIDLENGNGFDVLDAFPQDKFKVVFVTGHENFAIKAFKYRAFHYMLKPVSPQDLIQLVQEIIQDPVSIPVLNTSKRTPFPTIQGVALIEHIEINYFTSDEKYATASLENGEKVFISLSLKEIKELLLEQDFLQVHRSYIVRIGAVRKVQKNLEGAIHLVLRDKTIIPVSRRSKEDVLSRIGAIG